MATGTVKWYNTGKGYGFIKPENGSADIFVHKSALERAGLTSLDDGQKVRYDLAENRSGKSSADALELIEKDE